MYKELVSFIRSLYKTQENFIPLHSPFFGGNEKKYLEDCIDTTFVSSVGQYVDQFENMITDYTHSTESVVCVNGTNALHLALLLVGVKRDDEVLTQALTFVATVNAISYIGAKPVFIDVDKETMGLSPTKLDDWLKEYAFIKGNECFNTLTGRRIKACVPMHTFGHPTKIEHIIEVCNRYNIDLVEDAAESLGSFYKGQHTGTFGKIGILSFNGNKTITTGGGGMLLFKDKQLAQYAKHLTTQAKTPHRWEFFHDSVGYNYRMPNINAALGCAQMENIEIILRSKRAVAMAYKKHLEFNEQIRFFDEPRNCVSNFWLNTVLLGNKSERDQLLSYSNDNNVMMRPVWSLMSYLPMFSNCQIGGLENSHWFEERVVNLPSSVIL